MMDAKPRHINDEQLVEQFQNGREDALKLLIKRFHPTLVRVIKYQTRNTAPVEDIAQESWYAIIQQLAEVELKISFKAWAITIARRKAIDWVREQQQSREHTRQMQTELAAENDESDENEAQIERVRIAIQQLPATQRIVLKMFYLENLSLQEISKVLEVAQGTIKSRLFYAREKLKNLINQQTEE